MLARQNTGWLTFAVADCTLFLTPLTTSLSPRIMASKPVVAAVAAALPTALKRCRVWGYCNIHPKRLAAPIDVVIIGAGIAGISTAYELAIEGSHVIVL